MADWQHRLEIAVCQELGWRATPSAGPEGLGGWLICTNDGHCLGWFRDQDDAWEASAYAYASNYALTLDLAAREMITLSPYYGPRGHIIWQAAYCNASGMTGDTRWVGITNNRDWQRSASPGVAVCLAMLVKRGVQPPEGRPVVTY